MTAPIWALIVAVYGVSPHWNTKPHTFATFFDEQECRAAARHVESVVRRHDTFVAICVRQTINVGPSA